MKKKINIQLILLSSFAAMAAAAASMALFYSIFKNQVYDDIKDYTHIIQASGPGFLESGKSRALLREDGIRVTVVKKDGSVSYDSSMGQKEMENHKGRPEIKEALEHGGGTTVRWSATSSLHTFYYAERMEDGTVLRIGKDSGNIFHMLKRTGILALGLSLLVILLCGFLSRCLTKKLLSPIEKLALHPDGASQGPIYQEIEPFIQTIKEQHINILDHVRMRQEFTANVSHELKTPLTAISGYAELIESGMAGEQDAKRFAHEIRTSLDRLLDLINDILKLSELDDTEQEFELEQVDLYHAARSCLDMMDMQAAKQGVTLHLQGKPCIISANRNLIDELLYNLCSNAIRYNNRGGAVTVTAALEHGRPMLLVEDTGIGIPKEYQDRVFERFYRVDKGRSRQEGGTGLGLAIVKHIAAQHNAEIFLESEPGKGTKVKLIF